MRRMISVAICLFRLNIQRQVEYPLFLLAWGITIPLQYFTGVYLLKVLVERFQPLAGWSFAEIAFLYGLGLISHGLLVVFFVQTWFMDRYIVTGGFDRMLVRPLPVYLQFLCDFSNLIGVIDLIPGICIFFYGAALADIAWSGERVLAVILIIGGAVLIRVGIYTALGAVAFWTTRSGSLVSLGTQVIERTTHYPMAIYPQAVQWFLTIILPVGFIAYYPSAGLLGRPEVGWLGFAIWVPVIGVISLVGGLWVFRCGLARYEGTGS